MELQNGFDAFQSIRSAIKAELKWRSAGPIRDATALALLPLAGRADIDYRKLEHSAQLLKQNHSKLYFLRTSMRYALAAMLLEADQDPQKFAQTLSDGRKIWKALALRRASPYEGASLITILLSGNRTIDHSILSTLKAAFDRLKSDYFWHVGAFTLPALAMALQFEGSAPSDGAALFRELSKRKFPSRHRMSAALIGSISNKSSVETAMWMTDFHSALKSRRIGDATRRTTGIALASLVDAPADAIAEDIDIYRKKFRSGPIKSSSAGALSMNFVNAVRIANLKDSYGGKDMTPLASVTSALQAYIVMQEQAAATAAIAGGAVAASAGS